MTSLHYTFNNSEKYFIFEVRYDVGGGSSQTLNIEYEYDCQKPNAL